MSWQNAKGHVGGGRSHLHLGGRKGKPTGKKITAAERGKHHRTLHPHKTGVHK